MSMTAPEAAEVRMIDGLHTEIHGDPSAPALLMVHGFLSSRSQWRINLPALTTRLRVAVIELLGHGRSSAPETAEEYSVERYIQRLEAVREAMGVETWTICGQSFGAALTLNYALTRPDRVTRQVFTNSSASFRDFGAAEERARSDARIAEIRARGIAAIREQPMHPSNAARFPQAVKDEMVADAELLVPHAVAFNIERVIRHASLRERAGEIAAPTLLVNGRWEKKFQPLADQAEREMRNLTRVDLEGGHSINIEAAEGFDRAVLAFCDPSAR